MKTNQYVCFSKFQFDQYVRGIETSQSKLLFMYFNVEGPREGQKIHVFNPHYFNSQILECGKVKFLIYMLMVTKKRFCLCRRLCKQIVVF